MTTVMRLVVSGIDDAETVNRVTELMTRAAAGMALDGIHSLIVVGPDTEDEDEYDEADADAES